MVLITITNISFSTFAQTKSLSQDFFIRSSFYGFQKNSIFNRYNDLNNWPDDKKGRFLKVTEQTNIQGKKYRYTYPKSILVDTVFEAKYLTTYLEFGNNQYVGKPACIDFYEKIVYHVQWQYYRKWNHGYAGVIFLKKNKNFVLSSAGDDINTATVADKEEVVVDFPNHYFYSKEPEFKPVNRIVIRL